jgi:hypothetical protein
VLADAVPRWPDLDEVDVMVGDVGLDLDLTPQVFGHALTSPEADAVQISLGKRHHTFQPVQDTPQHPPPGDSEQARARICGH